MIAVALKYTPRFSPAERALIALPNKLRDLRPIMRNDIAPLMERLLLRHWNSKGAAFGHAWAPWATSTAQRRRAKGNASKGILRDTDKLFKSVFRDRPTDNRLKLVANGVQLEFNSRIPYAVYHQVGTQFMPERQIFPYPIPDQFKREARAVMLARLTMVDR